LATFNNLGYAKNRELRSTTLENAPLETAIERSRNRTQRRLSGAEIDANHETSQQRFGLGSAEQKARL
jgi:hypothetical protein